MKSIIVSEYMPPDHSGAGKAAYKLAKYFKQVDILYCVLTTSAVNSRDINSKKIISISRNFSKSKCVRILSKVVNIVIWIPQIVSTLLYRREEYSIIHCYTPGWFSFISVLVSKILNKKIIVELTLIDSDDPYHLSKSKKNKIKYFYKNYVISASNKLICLSPALLKRCIKGGINKERLFLCTRSVPINSIMQDDKNRLKKFGNENINLLFVGGFIKRKGVDILIEAFIKLALKYKQLYLIIVGPYNCGHHQIQMKNIADRLLSKNDLAKRVKFVGQVEDVSSYYIQSDIFVLPSNKEGFPNVLIEAMSFKKACIVRNIPDITDYIIDDGYNGYIFDGNVESLVKLIEYLVCNPIKKDIMGINAYETVRQRFSDNIIFNKYDNIYNSLK